MSSEEYAFLEKMHRAINIVLEIPCRETDCGNISNWCSNWNLSILVFVFKFSTYCSQSASYNQERNPSSTYAYSAFPATEQLKFAFKSVWVFRSSRKWPKKDTVVSSRGEGCGGYTLAAILEGIHISLVICVWGYTYHGDTHITVTPVLDLLIKCLVTKLWTNQNVHQVLLYVNSTEKWTGMKILD